MRRIGVRELVFCALFVALITVGTFIRVPMIGGDVFTLQFLFTLLAGLVLGARLGALAVFVYVALGLLGVPVFASGGGLGYVLQPTFGYLVGFVLQAYFCGFFSRRLNIVSFKKLLAVNAGGMVIVYIIGVSWFYFVSNYVIDAPISTWAVIFYCCILQLPPDLLLCAAAAETGRRCHAARLWLDTKKY